MCSENATAQHSTSRSPKPQLQSFARGEGEHQGTHQAPQGHQQHFAGGTLMEEAPAQKRHNNDIERCEEGRIGRGGHALPHDLQQERHAQDQPGYTAQQGIPRCDGTHFPPEDDPHNRCRNEEAQRYDQPGTELGINGHLGHRKPSPQISATAASIRSEINATLFFSINDLRNFRN